MSVTFLQIDSSFFCFSMESSHFLGISSPCGTLQNYVLRFFIQAPEPPKFTPKNLAQNRLSRLLWQIDRRCLGLLGGFRGWSIQWNHKKCSGADPFWHGNDIWLGAESNCLSACPSVRLSVCLSQALFLLFLFLDGIEPFFGHQFSMTKNYKTFSSIFYSGPLGVLHPSLQVKKCTNI